MDEWELGYLDGFQHAVMTVRELVEGEPQITVGAVLEALEAERGMLLTPGYSSEEILERVVRGGGREGDRVADTGCARRGTGERDL